MLWKCIPTCKACHNRAISTGYGKRFKWANIQEKSGNTSRHPTGIKDEGKGLETSITYRSGHVLQQTWQLPCCLVRAVPLSWYVLHALTAPPGLRPSGEAHAGNAMLLILVMLECETALCLSWAFDSPGSDISEMLSLHPVQKENSINLCCHADWSQNT